MKLSELYSEYFANWISGGNLVAQDKISLFGLKPLFDRFLTHDLITKVWVVRALPVEYDINLTELIRGDMFRKHPDVKTIIHFVNQPLTMNVRNSMFMRQFESISERYHQMEALFDEMTEDQRSAGVYQINPKTGKKMYITQKQFDDLKEEYDSYLYLHDQVCDGNTLSNTFYFIQASARSKKELKMYTMDLAALLTGEGVYFNELHGNISSYLDNFCPATYKGAGSDKFRSMLMTEENLAGLMPYRTMGLVGGKGVLMGLDQKTGLPFLLDFFGSGTAQINMILGKTGCGKTYFAFAVALYLIAMGVHISAIDIKGHEWDKLKAFVKTLVIGMDGVDSRFVNTLRLDDMECDTPEDALDAYNTAVRGTVKLFEIATSLSEREGNILDLEAILNRAVAKVFSQCGVKNNNPSTFKRTAKLKFSDVINAIQTLKTSSSFTPQQKELCQLVITRTSDFFLPEGRYAMAFQNELTLSDVLRSEAVIYSFNKNTEVMLDTLDTMRVFMVQFLDGKKQSHRKKQKKHTAAFYEELQRCEQFGSLVEEISQKVTGSRSNNVIIFLLLNAVSTFDSGAFAAIKSNITTRIVGKLNKEDVNKLVEEYDCAPIKEYMTEICEDDTNSLSHCFAIQYDTGLSTNKVMCRTVMPEDMKEHFNTRDRLES